VALEVLLGKPERRKHQELDQRNVGEIRNAVRRLCGTIARASGERQRKSETTLRNAEIRGQCGERVMTRRKARNTTLEVFVEMNSRAGYSLRTPLPPLRCRMRFYGSCTLQSATDSYSLQGDQSSFAADMFERGGLAFPGNIFSIISRQWKWTDRVPLPGARHRRPSHALRPRPTESTGSFQSVTSHKTQGDNPARWASSRLFVRDFGSTNWPV
jgi:hypothetical protein